jgi:hypothetical protein
LSVLTKLFVVLLVVSSLLLSASVVVFVNRVEDFHTQLDTSKKQSDTLKSTNARLTRDLADAQRALLDQQTQASNESGDLNRKLVEKDGELQKMANANGELTKKSLVDAATIKGTTDLARAAQEENKGLQQLTADLRNKYDEILKKDGELNTMVTVLDNQLRAVDHERQLLQEQLTEARAQAKAGGGATRPAGGAADAQTAAASAGPINGVVRSVEVLGGKKYATISVGSADNVTKGMRFNVVKGGEFLGYLTVDGVQPNEAYGQVEGKVEKIQPGVDVKTQL